MTATTAPTKLPLRSDVPTEDCWDLASLYETEAEWQADFDKIAGQIDRFADFQGRLGESVDTLLEFLTFDLAIEPYR